MFELNAKSRIELGKKTKALRRAGFLPAVVYGEEVDSQSVTVSARDFEKVYQSAGETGLVTLVVDGAKPLNVMIQDIAYEPLTGKPVHADFHSVRMDKEIDAKIPLVFSGEPPAVKNEGGILVKVMQEIEVRALPKNLPREIAVSVGALEKVGNRIQVKDIVIPTGVMVREDLDDVVVIIEAPRAEEDLAVVPAAEVVEVKTEQETKTEERAAKAAAKAESEKAV
ncbi:MAG: 50S ribosomal protein L25 [Candidatus Sungbacteria bacterium]|nr:50S ribosomal protein L25 [Candidatus Sungbacteria bacterium]